MNKKIPTTEWDNLAEWWDTETGNSGLWHQQHDINPVMFKILGKVKSKKVLEIGCGNGYFCRLLAHKGAKVVGTDLSKRLINFAANREKIKQLGIKYFVRNAAHLYSFKNRSFDVVVANMCLMDIEDGAGAIKEAARVLKKGGLFLFSITHPAFHDWPWVIIKQGKEKRFARAVFWYKLSRRYKIAFGATKFHPIKKNIIQYHRSVEFYVKCLIDRGLKVTEFKEIVTKKKMKKAEKDEKNITFRRSRYKTLAEKNMKEIAGKEIPLFLIIAAVKIK